VESTRPGKFTTPDQWGCLVGVLILLTALSGYAAIILATFRDWLPTIVMGSITVTLGATASLIAILKHV
jgi:hypothetical protein